MARRNKPTRRWSAYSMPHIRDAVHAYGAYVADHPEVIPLDSVAGTLGTDSGKSETFLAEFELLRLCTETDNLHWISADLCEVVGSTWPTVPEWTPSELVPSPHGMILFDKFPNTPISDDIFDSGEVAFDGFCWITRDDRILVCVLSRLAETLREFLAEARSGSRFYAAMYESPLVNSFTINLDSALPQGAGQLHQSMIDGDGYSLPAHFTSKDEMRDVLAVIGTTWLLMGQTGITETSGVAVPPTSRQRKAANARGEDARDVLVTDHKMSRVLVPARENGDRAERGTRRPATTRWWVRGHWRQQAYGPKRSLRKPIFIAPHTAGAKDGGLDKHPRVTRHRA